MAGLNYYDYTIPELPDEVFSYWKYDNYGTADLLSTSGTTVTNLPFSQSMSGSAFQQMADEKCFDIPVSESQRSEIWVKFDVYSSLTAGFGAYDWYDNSPYEDPETGSITFPNPNWGVRATTDGSLEILNESVVATYPNVFISNQLQTVLLHVKSSWWNDNGEIEVWVDGANIATYSGNFNSVEHFFLKTEDANTYFSNVVISEHELTFDDNAEGVPWRVNLILDTFRRLETSDTKLFDTTLDTERHVVCSYNKNFDTVRRIGTCWRYENFGNAFLLAVDGGTTVTDLPEEQSKTGSAYQIPGGTNIFGLQPTDEIWARFDVFLKSDDSVYVNAFENNRWNGIRINSYASYATFLYVLAANIRPGVWGASYTQYKSGKLTGFHSVLFHMISGNSQFGKIQLWVDDADNPIFDFTGDVNYGNDFTNFFITCARGTPLISNVVVSNCPLSFADNATVIGYSFVKNFDLVREVENAEFGRYLYPAIKVLLNFDDKADPFFDCAGNKWTAHGKPTISTDNAKFGKALQLDGKSYLEIAKRIKLGGRDYTIDGWFFIDMDTISDYRNIFEIDDMREVSHNWEISLAYHQKPYKELFFWNGYNSIGSAAYIKNVSTGLHHFAFVHIFADKRNMFFLDGVKVEDSITRYQHERRSLHIVIGGPSNSSTLGDLLYSCAYQGAVDSFRVIDGIALYNYDFEPPAEPMWFKKLSLANDTLRNVWGWAKFNADTIRQLSNKVIIAPAENGSLLDGVENSDVESIEISLAAQQLTDQLTYTTINPVDILQQVQGQYLDYKFNMRIEDTNKRGILTTCHCCLDIEELLFTQIAYDIDKMQRIGGIYSMFQSVPGIAKIEVQTIQKAMAKASSHISKIAGILSKNVYMAFDDFISTVNINQKEVTYDDLIRDIFGWSYRVPNRLINCYVRDNTIFVIQRGHEQGVIDLSFCNLANLTVSKKLVRTYWSATQTTTVIWGKEPIFGDKADDEDDFDIDDSEEPVRVLPRNEIFSDNNGKTTIQYSYDGDGNVTKTTTEFEPTNPDEPTKKTVVSNSYATINDKKVLQKEHIVEYEDDEVVNEKNIRHTYLTQGQQHITSNDSDGNFNNSTTGSARRDDRPTPYSDNGREIYYEEGFGHGYGYDQNGDLREIIGERIVENRVPGIMLVDTSFPIDTRDADFLRNLTDDIIWLNRKIQETVTFDLYDYPHVIDFNDKIIFRGQTYFLESNTVVRTPRIKNKQSLKIVRWYQ